MAALQGLLTRRSQNAIQYQRLECGNAFEHRIVRNHSRYESARRSGGFERVRSSQVMIGAQMGQRGPRFPDRVRSTGDSAWSKREHKTGQLDARPGADRAAAAIPSSLWST